MRTLTLTSALAGAATFLGAAVQPAILNQAQPGLWEISGAPGSNAPIRQCVANLTTLAEFEHRARSCTTRSEKDTATTAAIDYACGGAGFGHSEIDVITPRSLRISTQGISGGLPFNYVLQARRVDDCTKTVAPTHH